MLFIDSGAHSIYNRKGRVGKGYGTFDFSYYKTAEFKGYMDRYGQFLVDHKGEIDVAASLDVIFNPELSMQTQRYLEKNFGVDPIPVFHYGEDYSWLKKYMDTHSYIGIGGMGQGITKRDFAQHLAGAFKLLGESKQEFKTHGFAITSWDFIARYPFTSVDSTSFLKTACFGVILVPFGKHRDDGSFEFVVGRSPMAVAMSPHSKYGNTASHYEAMSPYMQRYVIQLAEMVGLPVEDGKCRVLHESTSARSLFNQAVFILYCNQLEQELCPYFSGDGRVAFLVEQTSVFHSVCTEDPRGVLLTYYLMDEGKETPTRKRFNNIVNATYDIFPVKTLCDIDCITEEEVAEKLETGLLGL